MSMNSNLHLDCFGPPRPSSPTLWQVFFVSGVIVGVLQLVVFPKIVKVVGITIWQRIGCLMCVPCFVAIPNAKAISWDDSSLFMASVVITTLLYSFQGMVSPRLSHGFVAVRSFHTNMSSHATAVGTLAARALANFLRMDPT